MSQTVLAGGAGPEEDDVLADGADEPARAGNHRPQALLFSFFGALVLDGGLPPIPAAVFLRLLGDLGVAEAAARATLGRMTRNGLLAREQAGRTARYSLTPSAEDLLRQGASRVWSPAPFSQPDGEWTLLSYSMPESRRDLRHRLRATLTWAGFGGLRDGVWIAPGIVDVARVFADADLAEVTDLAEWFAASPLPGTSVEAFVRRAWPLDRIREQHEAFLAAWGTASGTEDPLARITRLGADWLEVLRIDPGLPAAHLPQGWPAQQSAATYRRCFDELHPPAARALALELGTRPVEG
ncbi:PaaX family transcriptional regulator [Modestobacter sp. URMC 112]